MAEEPSGLVDEEVATDEEGRAAESTAGEPADDPSVEFREGRYLFCIVRPDEDAADASFSAEGIDGQEAGLVAGDDLAAVTQPCESLYDASDPETVRRWLLRHQAVVDAAGEVFGTPLPFRFDTVIVGDDDRVRSWLEGNAEPIDEALSELAGRWEYRIEVAVEEEAESASLEKEDERLASLREQIEAADEGRAFLHEKQYDERLRALRRERREARAEDVMERVEPFAERVEWNEGTGSTRSILGDNDGSGGSEPSSAGRSDSSRPAVSLALLATPDAAEEIGEELEAVADEPGVEVRYTGPWPPYTFAPEIDAVDER